MVGVCWLIDIMLVDRVGCMLAESESFPCRVGIFACRFVVICIAKSELLGCRVGVAARDVGFAWLRSWSSCSWGWSCLVVESESFPCGVGLACLQSWICRGYSHFKVNLQRQHYDTYILLLYI